MDVHVHRVAGQIEKEEQRRPVAGRDRRAIAGLCGAENERIANGTAAHEDVALPSCRSGLRGTLYEPRDL